MGNKQSNRPISNWLYNQDNGNYLLFGDGYFISYNPSTLWTFKLKRINDPSFKFNEEEETEETAIYIEATNSYLILNGDFRLEYEECSTLEQCKEVFRKFESIYRSRYCSGIDSVL